LNGLQGKNLIYEPEFRIIIVNHKNMEIVKRQLFFSGLVLSFLALGFAKAQNIQFEDANFKAALLFASPENGVAKDANGNSVAIDTNGDGEISQAEALNIYQLNIDPYKYQDYDIGTKMADIESMKGIEYFANLTVLSCRNLYMLKNLNLSALTKLKELDCSGSFASLPDKTNNIVGSLSNLILPKTSTLESLDCSGTSISSLDFLSGIPNLKKLYLNYINVENIKITDSQFSHLEELSVKQRIPNVTITVSDLPELTKFYCDIPALLRNNPPNIILFLSNLPKIDTLGFPGKKITINNLPNLTNLGFACESIVLKGVPKLTEIFMGKTAKTLDLSNVPNLVTLTCFFCDNLEILNLSKNIKLQTLNLSGAGIKTLDLSKNINLQYLDLRESPKLETLDISKNINLQWIDLSNTKIEALDISKNINLQKLDLYSPKIKTLDLSKNINLRWLGLGGDKIETLDVSKTINLQYLDLNGTKIKTLDVSKNINLQWLGLHCSGIKILDVSHNINLVSLNLIDCSKLTSLYMKNGVKKTFSYPSYNIIGANLNYICCDEDEIDAVKDYMGNKTNLTVTSECGTVDAKEILPK